MFKSVVDTKRVLTGEYVTADELAVVLNTTETDAKQRLRSLESELTVLREVQEGVFVKATESNTELLESVEREFSDLLDEQTPEGLVAPII